MLTQIKYIQDIFYIIKNTKQNKILTASSIKATLKKKSSKKYKFRTHHVN